MFVVHFRVFWSLKLALRAFSGLKQNVNAVAEDAELVALGIAVTTSVVLHVAQQAFASDSAYYRK